MFEVVRNEDRVKELKSFLSDNFIGSLATQGESAPSIATIFYVFDGNHLFFKSRTTSDHSLNLLKNDKVSLSVYDDKSTYKAKYGVQIRGTCERVLETAEMTKVVALYSKKFEGAGAKLLSVEELCSSDVKSTFYKIDITSFKIIDESPEGNRTIVEYIEWKA